MCAHVVLCVCACGVVCACVCVCVCVCACVCACACVCVCMHACMLYIQWILPEIEIYFIYVLLLEMFDSLPENHQKELLLKYASKYLHYVFIILLL